MKISEYEIAHGNNSEELKNSVEYLLRRGFQPFGNLAATSCTSQNDPLTINLYQPMVKYDQTKN